MSAPQPKAEPQSSEILTPEEFEFLQQLQQESTDNKEKSTDTPPKSQN